MSSITRNRILGESSEETARGVEATIQHLLSDVVRSQTGGMCNAHNDPSLYQIGDPHPCFPDLYCTGKRIRPEQGDNTRFVCDFTFGAKDWELETTGQFSMAGSLAAGKTTRDRDGNQIQLTYTYPDPPNYKDPLYAGQTNTQTQEVEIDEPTLLLRWSRYNTFSVAFANTQAALGNLNETSFVGFPAESVLCTRAEIEQAGQRWREIYEFQWKQGAQDWKVYTIFRQEDDNRPVQNPDAVPTDVAEKLVDVYKLYDFNLLGLGLPT